MLTFHRKFIEDILIKETGKIIKNCKLYNVLNGDTKVGLFYSGDNYSFVDFNEQKIRIDQNKRFFKRSEYTFLNQYTRELLGHFEIPNGVYLGEMNSKLHLLDGPTYQWTQNYSQERPFRSRASNIYSFDLVSKEHNIVYYGKMTPDIAVNYINPDQVFDGEIQSTDESLLLPILIGIYIMEEKFRRKEQDLG